MSYCTLEDLIKQYGEQAITLLTDRTNTPAVIIDETIVERAIADVQGEIDMHLHSRYQLPLSTVPLILKRIACVLVYFALHTRIDEDHPVAKSAEQQRKLLRGLAKGELSLGVDQGGAPAANTDVAQISPGRNDWGKRW